MNELVEACLLISDSEVLKIAAGAEEMNLEEDFGKITSVGVLTHNRTDSLKRCLVGYIENSKKYGRVTDFVVMDDSERKATRRANQQMLLSLKARYGVNLSYAGPEEKVGFAESLVARKKLPKEVLDFALFDVAKCGLSIGANRNALLLNSVGHLALSADDDTECRVARVPGMSAGLAVNPTGEFAEFWFFPDRAAALGSVSFVHKDLLAVHEQLLGKRLSRCIAGAPDPSSLSGDIGNSLFLSSMETGTGRVAATFTGLVGDSGLHLPAVYQLLTDDSWRRLTGTRSDYASACVSREVMRAPLRQTISRYGGCIAASFGYDHRTILPPFMPVQRGEDGAFAATMEKCFDNCYRGYLPWTSLHTPMEARSPYSADTVKSAVSGLRLSNLITACIRSAQISPAASNEERLRSLGKHFMALGSMKLSDFEEFVRLSVWRTQSSYLISMEKQFRSRVEGSDFWSGDVKRFLSMLAEALSREEYILPQDLLAHMNSEEARMFTRTFVSRFGQLLLWWPEIVESTRDLLLEGRRLATTAYAS